MGFPSDIQTRGLPQRDLTLIAGNSMSVDFLCVLNVLLLLFVDFDLCYLGDDEFAPIGAEFPNVGCDSTEAWAAGPIKLAPHKATSLQVLARVHLPGLDRASLRNASQSRARKTSSLVRFDMPEPPAAHLFDRGGHLLWLPWLRQRETCCSPPVPHAAHASGQRCSSLIMACKHMSECLARAGEDSGRK